MLTTAEKRAKPGARAGVLAVLSKGKGEPAARKGVKKDPVHEVGSGVCRTPGPATGADAALAGKGRFPIISDEQPDLNPSTAPASKK